MQKALSEAQDEIDILTARVRGGTSCDDILLFLVGLLHGLTLLAFQFCYEYVLLSISLPRQSVVQRRSRVSCRRLVRLVPHAPLSLR